MSNHTPWDPNANAEQPQHEQHTQPMNTQPSAGEQWQSQQHPAEPSGQQGGYSQHGGAQSMGQQSDANFSGQGRPQQGQQSQQYGSQPQYNSAPPQQGTAGQMFSPNNAGAQGSSSISAADVMSRFKDANGAFTLGGIGLLASLATLVLVFLGSCMTWGSADLGAFGKISVSGLDGDGVMTLILALIGIAVGVVFLIGKLPRKGLFGVTAASAIAFVIGFYDFVNLLTKDSVSPGFGLVIVVLFSAIATAGSALAALRD